MGQKPAEVEEQEGDVQHGDEAQHVDSASDAGLL